MFGRNHQPLFSTEVTVMATFCQTNRSLSLAAAPEILPNEPTGPLFSTEATMMPAILPNELKARASRAPETHFYRTNPTSPFPTIGVTDFLLRSQPTPTPPHQFRQPRTRHQNRLIPLRPRRNAAD